MGIEAECVNHTGLLLADDLRRLRTGDVLIPLAYGRVYAELDVVLNHAQILPIAIVLVTDTLTVLRNRVDDILTVARGRSDMMSMHTATLGLIEAILVGIAARKPSQTILSPEALNMLRGELAGEPMDLPTCGFGAVKRDAKRRPGRGVKRLTR